MVRIYIKVILLLFKGDDWNTSGSNNMSSGNFWIGSLTNKILHSKILFFSSSSKVTIGTHQGQTRGAPPPLASRLLLLHNNCNKHFRSLSFCLNIDIQPRYIFPIAYSQLSSWLHQTSGDEILLQKLNQTCNLLSSLPLIRVLFCVSLVECVLHGSLHGQLQRK